MEGDARGFQQPAHDDADAPPTAPAAPPCASLDALDALAIELDEADTDPPVHRIVPAAECQPLKLGAAVSSVFALAEAPQALALCRLAWRAGRAAAHTPPPCRIEREPGLVRLVQLRVEDTPEWQQREQERRARQVVPRPPRRAKSKGRALRRAIEDGAADWDD